MFRFLLISEDCCRDMAERDGSFIGLYIVRRPSVTSYVSGYDSCYLRRIQDF